MKKNRKVQIYSDPVHKPKDVMWAIGGKLGWYVGTWCTRQGAIVNHCAATGKTWEQCKADGDYVKKVILVEV